MLVVLDFGIYCFYGLVDGVGVCVGEIFKCELVCENKDCGKDGCGGMCGVCDVDEKCNSLG